LFVKSDETLNYPTFCVICIEIASYYKYTSNEFEGEIYAHHLQRRDTKPFYNTMFFQYKTPFYYFTSYFTLTYTHTLQ